MPHRRTTQLASLKRAFPAAQMRTDPDSLNQYGQDWTRVHAPKPLAVCFPRSVADVQRLVKWARKTRSGLVPSGGRTGLSGGACAPHGEVVVSFEKMNRIFGVDSLDQTLECEAGAITEAVQQYAREQGFYFPVDFASRGSSQIGGNIATNAGGVRVVRYGNMRAWVAGLEIVTGAGEVLRLDRALPKDASGYDLMQLFIGSEGTLGFITRAILKLTPPPADARVMLFGLDHLEGLASVLDGCRRGLTVNAMELFTEAALKHVTAAHSLKSPFSDPHPYYLLVEFENPGGQADAAVEQVFARALEEQWVADAVLSQSDRHDAELWALRENISESLARHTPWKNDISVRISRIQAFVADLEAGLAQAYPEFEVVWFGHVGDGNLHVNVLKPETMPGAEFQKKCARAAKLLFQILAKHGGSVSAEHGIGLLKKPYLGFTRTKSEIDQMKAIKKIYDPDRIMNPGKIF
ncbi:MAG: FAD-binding oxidoreductase [Bacteriovoracia bacterium]